MHVQKTTKLFSERTISSVNYFVSHFFLKQNNIAVISTTFYCIKNFNTDHRGIGKKFPSYVIDNFIMLLYCVIRAVAEFYRK